jgi:hypothetical protein
MSISGNVVPVSNGVGSLGESGKIWDIAYIRELNVTNFTNSIDGSKIANGTISSTQIANGSILTVDISDHAITYEKIAANAVTNTRIANGAVTHAKLSSDCVQSHNIADGTIMDVNISTNAAIAFSKINAYPSTINFVAKLLNRIFELYPQLQDQRIKNILLNNSKLIKKMNDLKGLAPIVIGRLDKTNLENICRYEGELTFIDRRINDQTVYNLNTLTDDIMKNPTKPITKYNDDFHSEYEQLITDSQADFIRFNNGTNFIRKIKIIHSKINLIYDDIQTIIGGIKTEFIKQEDCHT